MTSFETQVKQVTELISLPEVYMKFTELMDDPTSAIEDFAQVIRLDPSLSAKLLKAVNSVYYGFSGEIISISRAVQLIGIQQLHHMVLSISVVNSFVSLNFPSDIVDLKNFWRSNLLTGTLARLLAKELNVQPAERFFIMGLLHEIGHLVLYGNFAQLARQTIQRAKESNIDLYQAEKEVLGCHYGDIGAMLMEQWKLPHNLQQVTRYQPTPGQAPDSHRETSIVHIAHAYAHWEYLENQRELEDMIDPSAWETTQLDPEFVTEIMQSALVTSEELERIILRAD